MRLGRSARLAHPGLLLVAANLVAAILVAAILVASSLVAAILVASTACGPRKPLPPGATAVDQAPFRADEEAGLEYVALHFADLYPGKGPDTLVPVRPTLGLPALGAPGALVTVHYLARATPKRARAIARELRLLLASASGAAVGTSTPGPSVRSSPVTAGAPSPVTASVATLALASEEVATRALSHGITHIRVRARLPKDAPSGLYDLLHLRPSWRARSDSAVDLRPPPGPAEPLVFVHLTDLHHGERPDPRLAQTLAQVARLHPRPAFAVVTGDLVEFGPDGRQWAEVRRILAALPLPVFVTLGNHDYYRAGAGHAPGRRPGHPEEAGLRNFLRTFHPFPAFRFSAGGHGFMAMDTGPCATLRSLWRGQWITTEGIGAAQLADLGRFLSSPSFQGHVLLAHAPPRARLDPRADGCDPGRHGSFLQGRDAFDAMLLASWRRRPRPLVLLHGHLHWNDLYGRSPRPGCRFEVVPEPQPFMGTLPCWRPLPIDRSPLLVGTQSATRSNPIRSGGLLDPERRFGEGAGAARGFRLLRIAGTRWESALYRLYHRTPAAHRAMPDGYLPPASARHDALPACPPLAPRPE